MQKVLTFILFSIISIFGYCDDIKVLGSSNPSDSNTTRITKGQSDNRTYQLIQLNNGLRALLISDPDSDKAAASMRVYAGNYDNPEDALGIAHFTEHMLFLGNQKYPKPEEYKKFISENQGQNNAVTDFRDTVYYFDILAGKFGKSEDKEGALDRFSQFFISPLFLQNENNGNGIDNEMINKEKHAVDSEYQNGLKNDDMRLEYVDKATSNQNHPYSKFEIGNLQTLSSDSNSNLTEKVKNFYNKHYFAENMALTLYGPQPIDELQRMAETYFSSIKSGQSEPTPYKNIPIYRKEDLGKIITIQSAKDQQSLILSFPTKNEMQQYLTKPSSYIIDMLTRKDRDSLYEYLKTRSWITPSNGLTANYANLTYETFLTVDLSLFCIKFKLTKEGFKNYQKIIQHTFEYLELIKTQGIKKQYFDEMQKIEQLKFDNKTKGSPINTVRNTILPLNNGVNAKDILSFRLYFDFDKASIQQTFESLTPENLRIILMAKNVDTNQTETWYQVPYTIEDIPEDLLKQWGNPTIDQKFKLRERNQYISDTPVLLYTGEQQLNFSPIEKHSDLTTALWYLPDQFFNNTKINLQSILLTPLFSHSIENYLLANMYTELLKEYINIQYAPAIDALNAIQVNWTRYGLEVKIEGYSLDKLITIHTKVIQDIMENFQPLEQRFNDIKDIKAKKYADALLYQPRDIVNETPKKLSKGDYSAKELSAAIQQIDFKQLQDFITTVKTDGFALRHFIYGNVDKALIEDIDIQMLSDNLKQNSDHNRPYIEYIKNADMLPDSDTFDHHLKNTTVVMRVYPYAKRSDESTVKSRLLDMIIKPDFYKQIRTEQQLGYVVWSGKYYILYRQNDFGLYFFIQCSKTLQEIIQQDIEATANNHSAENVGILARHIEHVYSTISSLEKQHLQQLVKNFLNNPKHYKDNLVETIKQLSIDESRAETQKQALLNQEIDLFVKSTTKKIADLTNDELDQLKQSLVKEFTKKPENRDEVLRANFTEIMTGRNQFNRNQEIADLVKGITKEKLLEFYKETTQSENVRPKTIIGQYIAKSVISPLSNQTPELMQMN